MKCSIIQPSIRILTDYQGQDDVVNRAPGCSLNDLPIMFL